MTKKDSGITLIALVVTIVVILILAGITIGIVFSDDGIIAKAREAANSTNESVIEDQASLNQASNFINNVLSETIKGETLPYDGSYSEKKGVNTPNLAAGMTAIKWNGSEWESTTGDDEEWYEYGTTAETKKWANAVVGGSFDSDGTLNLDSDYSMFVWIPRYAYRITSLYHTAGDSTTAGTIEVEFMKGTTNEGGTGKTIVEYNNTTTSNYTQFPNGYVIHPAFEYGETVSGLWVAKFEASPAGATTTAADSEYNGTDKDLEVQPGVSSWRDIRITNMYDVCLNFNSALNSHLMKNDEWGAAAYLSKSAYGKETEEVWINNSSNYITGSAGSSVTASSDTG